MPPLNHLQVVDDHYAHPTVGDLLSAMACAEAGTAREIRLVPAVDKRIEFLAFVAHELRNPLAPIRTAAALITQGRPEDRARARGIIERQVDHLARMIDDILDMARSSTGKLTLSRRRLDLRRSSIDRWPSADPRCRCGRRPSGFRAWTSPPRCTRTPCA